MENQTKQKAQAYHFIFPFKNKLECIWHSSNAKSDSVQRRKQSHVLMISSQPLAVFHHTRGISFLATLHQCLLTGKNFHLLSSHHQSHPLVILLFNKEKLVLQQVDWKCLGEILIKGSEEDDSFSRWLVWVISNGKRFESFVGLCSFKSVPGVGMLARKPNFKRPWTILILPYKQSVKTRTIAIKIQLYSSKLHPSSTIYKVPWMVLLGLQRCALHRHTWEIESRAHMCKPYARYFPSHSKGIWDILTKEPRPQQWGAQMSN